MNTEHEQQDNKVVILLTDIYWPVLLKQFMLCIFRNQQTERTKKIQTIQSFANALLYRANA